MSDIWEEPEQCNDCGDYYDPNDSVDGMALCPDCQSEQQACESCGSVVDVGEDPNGELLCPDCADEAWL